MWRNCNPHASLVGMEKIGAAIGKVLTAPQKVKQTVTIGSSNSTPRYILKRKENIRPHRNLYTNIHSSIIHSSPKVETIQMFIT